MARPNPADASPATHDSDYGGDVEPGVKVKKRDKFPPACVKCGAKGGLITRRRTFVYVPKAIYVAFLFGCVGMVLGLFLCVASHQRTDLTVSTCSKCTAAWSRATRLPIVFFAGSLVATLAASWLVWLSDADLIWLPLVVGLLVAGIGPIAVHVGGRKHRVWARTIDETSVTLVGVHPEVVAALEVQ